MTIYVFTGPSLPPNNAREELDAIYLPPVSQGDVYRVALKRPLAIGIIDGYFENVPSVWHKEILWAMSRGIHVYGSASMGALRAAELTQFGMIGVGAIFEAFRNCLLEDDDEVAVTHGPMELGYPVLSEAMVNIRRTLADAHSSNVISHATHVVVEAVAKKLFYRDRNYPLVIRNAEKQHVCGAELDGLVEWLPRGKVDQKREDALLMLRAMRVPLAEVAEIKCVQYSFQQTSQWNIASRLARERSRDPESRSDVNTWSGQLSETVP